MKRIITGVGPCTLTPNPADPFTILVRCVISQQISTKAAESIYGRLAGIVGGPPTPMAKIAKLTEAQFKECGVSGPKQRTILAVIDHVKTYPELLPGIENRDNETIREQLTAIKGIGPWSVDMFLIFGLGRPDVLAAGDYGVRVGMKRAFDLPELPKPDKAAELSEPWKPYRSVAMWYLWQSLDNVKEENPSPEKRPKPGK